MRNNKVIEQRHSGSRWKHSFHGRSRIGQYCVCEVGLGTWIFDVHCLARELSDVEILFRYGGCLSVCIMHLFG